MKHHYVALKSMEVKMFEKEKLSHLKEIRGEWEENVLNKS